jgi:hypothetical protein
MTLKIVAKQMETLVAWPFSPDELLRAFESYARLRLAYPMLNFEIVLFCRNLPEEFIETVLNADDRLNAAERLLNTYLNALD